jgi:hypothetical protein
MTSQDKAKAMTAWNKTFSTADKAKAMKAALATEAQTLASGGQNLPASAIRDYLLICDDQSLVRLYGIIMPETEQVA